MGVGGGPDATTSLKTPGVKPRPRGSPTWPQPLKMYLLLAGAPCAPPPREAPGLAGRGTTPSLAGFPEPAVGGLSAQTPLNGDGMSSPGTARSGDLRKARGLCAQQPTQPGGPGGATGV